jgi:hypothetical protein
MMAWVYRQADTISIYHCLPVQRAIDQLQKDLAASKVAEGRLQTEARQASQVGMLTICKTQ